MPTDHGADLKKIRTFPALVRFLHDKMGWPINTGDFEELTFEYTPEELGIDPASAAKILEIKRLRPLSPNQPWGIFFVKFEPKKLPVVALRRILSRVALKKRASANSDERAAWAADDLLFVSNFGEGDERQISLAHFSQNEHKNDLPTLKVLGWDNLDTILHLDRVDELLTERLAWPEDEKDVARWRESWGSAFILRHREVITTSKVLAVRLAELARAIRDRIKTVLAIETENGPVTKLMKAFQEALIHDLAADSFADMYAQTIAYGLLSARVTNPDANTADGFAAQLPVTNPFLKELLETFLHVGGRKGKAGRGSGIDFDELGVSEVVELLDDANMEAVVRDFGDRNPQEDPVIHFYELFLKEYDAIKRMQRGVFYTPRPVVSYIVRSVDELLRTEFGLEYGLADTATWGEMAKRHMGLKIPEGVAASQAFVQILDPATGTGTFLVEVIDLIHKRMLEKWKAEGHKEKKIESLWNEYVRKHLLPRLHGYELLMAPYAIAHLKIGLKLYETGYHFSTAERARIYLTNALEPAHDFSGRFVFAIPALAHEAQAVNKIKREQRFTVVIGNPPYAGISSNMSESAQRMVDAYRTVDGAALNERKLWLQDDYVKFIRMAQTTIESARVGVLGYITNHGYLDNPTFRGMRQSLMGTFSRIRVLDLHGNANKKEQSPDGSEDKNVFDIRQGVAICLATRDSTIAAVKHADVWGSQESKYSWLATHSVSYTGFATLTPNSPFYFFEPQNTDCREEYEAGFKLTEAMPIFGLGFQSSRDHLVVAFNKRELEERIERFFAPNRTDSEVRNEFFPGKVVADYAAGDTRQWSLSKVRHALRADQNWRKRIRPCLYRPFDWRVILYDKRMVDWPRPEVLGHMLEPNLCLLANRQSKEDFAALCTIDIPERKIAAVYDASSSFPLYLYRNDDALELTPGRRPNYSHAFMKALAARLGVPQTKPLGVPAGVTPEDIFYYAYAVFHSPGYRSRYAEFHKVDFPRLPLTSKFELFRKLARLGGELVSQHLVEAPTQQALSARYDKAAKTWRYQAAKAQRLPVTLSFNGPEKPIVEKVGWSNNTVWIDAVKPKKGEDDTKITGSVGFRGMPEEVWNFHIGGYQVCEKWLKDRKDRTLTAEDIAHYHRIVIALHETIRIMREIDEIIDTYGGWPGAFVQAASAIDLQEPVAGEKSSSERMVCPIEKPIESKAYRAELMPLLTAAELGQQKYGSSIKEIEERQQDLTGVEVDRSEVMCLIRQIFTDGGGVRNRDTVINALAKEMGYTRVDDGIRGELENSVRTAVRRGILDNRSGDLTLLVRTITDYDRDFMKDQFLASLSGRTWADRDEAIRAFSRWMGFRRVGPAIDEMARSLINGLLREGMLEKDGLKIRRHG